MKHTLADATEAMKNAFPQEGEAYQQWIDRTIIFKRGDREIGRHKESDLRSAPLNLKGGEE